MNNKKLIEKAVLTIGETKDSIEKLNDLFKELNGAYDRNELYINTEEAQSIQRWVDVIIKEDIIGKTESILKEVFWRSEFPEQEEENKTTTNNKHTILKSLDL